MRPREFYSEREVLAQLPPGSGVHFFDTGHFWNFDAPDETVAAVKTFLERVT